MMIKKTMRISSLIIWFIMKRIAPSIRRSTIRISTIISLTPRRKIQMLLQLKGRVKVMTLKKMRLPLMSNQRRALKKMRLLLRALKKMRLLLMPNQLRVTKRMRLLLLMPNLRRGIKKTIPKMKRTLRKTVTNLRMMTRKMMILKKRERRTKTH